MTETRQQDPYTPPPMHHDRSGAVLRVGLLAVMLGALGFGYTWYAQQPQTALVPEVMAEQQLADAGYQVAPETLPEAVPPTPALAVTPAPQQRRAAPVERSPEPAAESEPAPIPPIDTPPPSGTVGSM